MGKTNEESCDYRERLITVMSKYISARYGEKVYLPRIGIVLPFLTQASPALSPHVVAQNNPKTVSSDQRNI